jgi:hypothetical protein
VPQPSRRCCRPSGRHGLPARTLAIRRPCGGKLASTRARRHRTVQPSPLRSSLLGRQPRGNSPGRCPRTSKPHPAGTRVGAWPLLRLSVTMARHGIVPAFARCTEFLARAARLATTAQPGMSGRPVVPGRAAGPARRRHGSEQPRPRAGGGAAVRGGDQRPPGRGGHLPGDRRPVRRGPDPGQPRQRLPGDGGVRPGSRLLAGGGGGRARCRRPRPSRTPGRTGRECSVPAAPLATVTSRSTEI